MNQEQVIEKLSYFSIYPVVSKNIKNKFQLIYIPPDVDISYYLGGYFSKIEDTKGYVFDLFSSYYNNNTEKILLQSYQVIFENIIDKDFKVKQDYVDFFGHNDFLSIVTNHNHFFIRKVFIEQVFKKSLDPIAFLLKLKCFSSIFYKDIRPIVLNLIETEVHKKDDKNYFSLAKHISKCNELFNNKESILSILNIFAKRKECLDIICENNSLFKQYLINFNNQGFYFIDDYYKDSNLNLIDIYIEKLCKISFIGLEKEISILINHCAMAVAQQNSCEIIISQKNHRMVCNGKNKNKLVRNKNITIFYNGISREDNLKFCDFFKFLLENILNEIFENKANIYEKNIFIKNIYKNNFHVTVEKYFLDFKIPEIPTNKMNKTHKF